VNEGWLTAPPARRASAARGAANGPLRTHAPLLQRLPMVLDSGSRFLVSRSERARARIVLDADAPAARALQDGEARLAVHRFAFSLDDLRPGLLGGPDWRAFASEDDAWGCIPVWGFAAVSESRCARLEAGTPVQGCLPMGTHRVVRPTQVDGVGFVDGLSQRRYEWRDVDPRRATLQALLRPAFAASFAVVESLADAAFFGARRVLVSGAASKAGCAAAFCLAQRAERPRVIGLSSPANAAFVRSLGCWDDVVPYAELASLGRGERTVFVDFTGSSRLRHSVQAHFGDALAPGVHAGARLGEERAHFGAAWCAFVDHVGDAPAWHVREGYGADAVETAYRSLLAGATDPREVWMLAL
jgi:hypothetical protein